MTKNILIISPFYAPNIGGVETHLTDLTNELDKKNYKTVVLTYSPITTSNVSWEKYEKIGNNTIVHRFRWIGGNNFYKLEKYPLINLLYITPYLLIRSIVLLFFSNYRFDVVHSHGINGAIIGIILKKIFSIKKHVVSIYSTYDNVPLNSLTTKIVIWILNHTDHILTQSNSSVTQLTNLKVNKNKISRYYHWVDLKQFKPKITKNKKFTVLFVGRMIPPKNAYILAKVAIKFPKIQFIFIGTGLQFAKIETLSKQHNNINLIGDVPYSNLHNYYQQASVLCVPSKYHEGWGRIIAESISCATPVISSNLGGTIEAADTSVAIFIKPTVTNFTNEIKKISTNKKLYLKFKQKCRQYALKHYSNKNLSYITNHY